MARSFINDLTSLTVPDPGISGAKNCEIRNHIARAISAGKRIALFLDYDGTLREIEREPAVAEPTPPVCDLLKRLSDLPNVDVTIISGRSRNDLEAWFGTFPFRLIAEHGASRRQPGALIWEELDRTVNYAWKKELLNILRLRSFPCFPNSDPAKDGTALPDRLR